MRINDELEKSLLELEEKNNDNVLAFLDVAQALETTYKHINNCSLKDEKDFIYQTENYVCKICGTRLPYISITATDNCLVNDKSFDVQRD